jgi:hypothetical protein
VRSRGRIRRNRTRSRDPSETEPLTARLTPSARPPRVFPFANSRVNPTHTASAPHAPSLTTELRSTSPPPRASAFTNAWTPERRHISHGRTEPRPCLPSRPPSPHPARAGPRTPGSHGSAARIRATAAATGDAPEGGGRMHLSGDSVGRATADWLIARIERGGRIRWAERRNLSLGSRLRMQPRRARARGPDDAGRAKEGLPRQPSFRLPARPLGRPLILTRFQRSTASPSGSPRPSST